MEAQCFVFSTQTGAKHFSLTEDGWGFKWKRGTALFENVLNTRACIGSSDEKINQKVIT